MPDLRTTTALADDPIGGLLTVTDGIVHYLTRCCAARTDDTTSTETAPTCRSCRRRVPAETATAWAIGNDTGWRNYQQQLTAYFGEHATLVAEQLRQRATARAHHTSPAA